MAVIGKFTRDGAGYRGHIETLTMRAKLTLEPNTNKKSDKAPDFRIIHVGEGFTGEIGAAWIRTAKKSGSQYLSLSIHDDPSLAEPLNCRLVKTGAENGHTLFWDRPDNSPKRKGQQPDFPRGDSNVTPFIFPIHRKETIIMTATTDFLAGHRRYHENLSQANSLNKTALFDALAEANIDIVTVTFDGEGDSGQIQDVTALAQGERRELPEGTLQYCHAAYGDAAISTSPFSFTDAIESLCYDYLSQEHGGWENNDGGFGEFTFHVGERRVELAFNARFSDYTSYSHTF